MKLFLIPALLATFSISSFASSSTSDQYFVEIQNNGTKDSFSLNTETTRTAYRTEIVDSICYRQVFEGYQTVCDRFSENSHPLINVGVENYEEHGGDHDGGMGHGGDHDGGRGHDGDHDGGRGHDGDHDGGRGHGGDHGGYPGPMPICYSRPVYRMEAYSCQKSISVPYEVFDHSSTANVNVNIAAAPNVKTTDNSCGVSFNLTGDSLLPTNNCADYVAIADQTVVSHGYVKNYDYAIKLLDAETILAPLYGHLQELNVHGSDLVVKTGNLNNAKNFTLKLYVQRRRLLKKDVVLIDRVLNSNEFSYQANDARTGYVHLNLQNLIGNFESSKKNVIRVSLDVNINSAATINNSLMPSLHQEASITINK